MKRDMLRGAKELASGGSISAVITFELYAGLGDRNRRLVARKLHDTR